MTLASENYRSGQPISEYIQNNLAPHFSPDLINPQHFCHSARRKPVRLSKSGFTLGITPGWADWQRGGRQLATLRMYCSQCMHRRHASMLGGQREPKD